MTGCSANIIAAEAVPIIKRFLPERIAFDSTVLRSGRFISSNTTSPTATGKAMILNNLPIFIIRQATTPPQLEPLPAVQP